VTAVQIVDARFEPCTQRLRDPTWKFARATVPNLEGHVLVLTDDVGTRGCGYVHAIPAITTHGAGAEAALALLAPLLVGRRADDLAGILEEIDATLAFNPSVKAGIDMALHDLLARRLGVPVHVLLGGRLHDRIAQSRILPIKQPADMAAKAAELAEAGYRQLKLKLSGDTALDAARIAAVRHAAGSGVALAMSLQAASTIKVLPFACELAEHLHLLDDPFTELAVTDGAIDVPRQAPGCGVEFNS